MQGWGCAFAVGALPSHHRVVVIAFWCSVSRKRGREHKKLCAHRSVDTVPLNKGGTAAPARHDVKLDSESQLEPELESKSRSKSEIQSLPDADESLSVS